MRIPCLSRLTRPQPPTPRHVDVRNQMHAPMGDIQARAAGKNPLKVGTEQFDPGNRKLRPRPEPLTGQAALQHILRTDAATYGFAPATPVAKCTFSPGVVESDDQGLITSLRSATLCASPASPPSAAEQSFSTPRVSASSSPASDVFARLTSPKSLCGTQRLRFNESGEGLGILGSRDDTTNAELIAGQAVILRGTTSTSPSKIRDPNSDYAPPLPCAAAGVLAPAHVSPGPLLRARHRHRAAACSSDWRPRHHPRGAAAATMTVPSACSVRLRRRR